jgi:hypothetical protein
MTLTIIQGCERKVTRKENYCEGACDHMAVKERQQEQKHLL